MAGCPSLSEASAEARHRHVRARQFFYVLTGQLELELEGVRHRLAAREGLEVPPGMAHQVRNVGDDVAEFLVIAAPPVGADRVPAPLES